MSKRTYPYRQIQVSEGKGFDRHRCEPVSVGLSALQPGDKYFWENSRREHFCLMQYTVSGEGAFQEGGQTFALTPGKGFLVVCPSDTRYWLPPEKTWEFIYMLAVGDMALYLAQSLLARCGSVLEMPRASAPVQTLFRLYEEALHAEPLLDKYRACGLAFQFFMEMHSRLDIPTGEVPEGIVRARSHIEGNFHDRMLGVDNLARLAGYSKYHFTRLFKQYIGQSPYAYILKLRLRQALDQIITTNRPLKEIGRAVGFNDHPYFCNTFKSYYNFTPSAVRQRRSTSGDATNQDA
jgi:AraC-like DNA-binding protein/quercetin dioxygenase-like cupin family protein